MGAVERIPRHATDGFHWVTGFVVITAGKNDPPTKLKMVKRVPIISAVDSLIVMRCSR